MAYCIYMHKNKINGKVYIGQTCQKPEYRWGENGKRYAQCPRFYNAIQKYGWDNFEHIILFTNLTLEEANAKEEELISFYNATQEQYGYNLQKGGINREITKETKIKLSTSVSNRWNDPNFKKHFSEIMKEKWKDPEYREKVLKARKGKHYISVQGRKNISKARKEYIAAYGTPTQGKGHTEETKQKIRESKIGEKNPMYGKTTSDKQKQKMKEMNSCPVRCLETQQIFYQEKKLLNGVD